MLNQKIKQLRIEKGLSQADVAKALHVSRQTISRWENGRNRPEMDNFVQMAELFDIPVTEILPPEFKNLVINLETKETIPVTEESFLKQEIPLENTTPLSNSQPDKNQSNENHSFDALIQLLLCFIGVSIPILGIGIIIFALLKIRLAKNYQKIILIVGLCCLLVNFHNSYFLVKELVFKDADFKIEKVD